jgi:hypothetical protein
MTNQAQAREAYIAEKTAEIIDLRARASVESDTTKALKMLKAAKVEEAMLQEWIASGEEVVEWGCDFDDEEEVVVETSRPIEKGVSVTITNNLPAPWFNHPRAYPINITGQVLKVFKNGKVAVRVKELGGKVIHFKVTDITAV